MAGKCDLSLVSALIYNNNNYIQTGSDIVIGWVKNGQVSLKDCYATAKATPQIDAQQDYILLDGVEVDGYTILKFKRKLVTCDKGKTDVDIKVICTRSFNNNKMQHLII